MILFDGGKHEKIYIIEVQYHPYNKNKKLEQEQALLVSPLYAKLNKNDEIVDFMNTYKISRLNIYSDSQRDDGDAQRKKL